MVAFPQGQPLPPKAWAFQFHNWTDAEADVYDCNGVFFATVPPATAAERAPPPSGSGVKRTTGTIPDKDQYAAMISCPDWRAFTAKGTKGKKSPAIPLEWGGGCGMPENDDSTGFSPWAQASLGTPPKGYWLCNTWLPQSAPPGPHPGGWPQWLIVLIALCLIGGGFFAFTQMKKN